MSIGQGRSSGGEKRGVHRRRGLVSFALGTTILLATASPQALGITTEPPPQPASGLPDGRGYEQVSPTNKFGSDAGAFQNEARPGVATADGRGILFFRSGPFGEAFSGVNFFSVAVRAPGGWVTADALPRPLPPISVNIDTVQDLLPSQDLTHLAFANGGTWTLENPGGESGHGMGDVYLFGREAAAISWLGRPATEASPVPAAGENEDSQLIGPSGGSPNLETVYFTYHGTLLAQDAPRSPYVAGNNAFGMYESHDGVLVSAGVRPDGSIDQFGAVPAAGGQEAVGNANPEELDGDVSQDGSRMFFVSPDPRSAHPAEDPPELYVRIAIPGGSHRVELVSRSLMLPLVGGLPAAAPHGAEHFQIPVHSDGGGAVSYVFAAPDGSKAFFASTDQLTSNAPNDGATKVYLYDIVHETLRYIPNVTMPIIVSSNDGSRALFENVSGITPKLELLSLSGEGQAVTEVAELPPPERTETNSEQLFVAPARATADGAVFAFQSDAPIPGFNDGGGFEQVYRYEATASTLTCVSCPSPPAKPVGDANLSNDAIAPGGSGRVLRPTRGISSDGGRVFFDTPNALVPQDVNGKRDVYEWEGGKVYLISSGQGPRDSFLIDSSESGDDLFIATADGLAPGDTDGSYDVYDVRVGGGATPPTTNECITECQGPPGVPLPLMVPASAALNGPGNLVANPSTPAKPKPLTRAQKLAKALKACQKKVRHVNRKKCEKGARVRYGPRGKKAVHKR